MRFEPASLPMPLRRACACLIVLLALAAGWPAFAQPTDTPAQTAPGQSAPAQTAPAQTAPGQMAPAQVPPPPAAAPAPAAGAPAANPAIHRLDSTRMRLEEVQAALKRESLDDAALAQLRARLDPIGDELRQFIETAAPRAEAARARLQQLGPAPDADAGQKESPEIAQDRVQRERVVREADEALRLARALLVELDQVAAEIADRRRALLARTLLARGGSVLDPGLWLTVAQNAPRDYAAIRIVLSDWTASLPGRLARPQALSLLLALAAAIVLAWARLRLQGRFVPRDPAEAAPSETRAAMAAVARMLLGTVPIAIGCYLVLAAIKTAGVVPPRLEPVARAILFGIAFVAFARATGDALLSPHARQWRVVRLDDPTARRVMRLIWRASALVAAGAVAEAALNAISAGVPITVCVRSLFALAFAWLLADTLRRMHSAQEEAAQESGLGPYVPVESRFAAPLRLLGWAAALAIAIAALAGYVSLAAFLVDQVTWLGSLAALLLLALLIVDRGIGAALEGDTRLSLMLQTSVGLRRRAVEQFGVIVSGVLKVILIVFAGIMALAPWGLQSVDLLSSLRAAFFGFRIGEFTVSLSSLLFAGGAFALALAATRAVQSWLDTRYLPATDLDSGLRNSISTGFGYVGIVIAAAIAFAQLGLSFDKITIVAGALSVGIGFGLQSVVSNFVSGLILLWERSIKVGDWVIVGTEQGYVKRINVRATEIETFDRASVMIPNANLISGVVTNRVHNDRTGRIVIPVGVSYDAEPEAVAAVLEACAREHHDVLTDPPPRVWFVAFGESSLNFELMCFVPEVDRSKRITSELHFAIFRKLKEAGIGIPYPHREVIVRQVVPPLTGEATAPAPGAKGQREKPEDPERGGEETQHV